MFFGRKDELRAFDWGSGLSPLCVGDASESRRCATARRRRYIGFTIAKRYECERRWMDSCFGTAVRTFGAANNGYSSAT